jgi:hypothetical protein
MVSNPIVVFKKMGNGAIDKISYDYNLRPKADAPPVSLDFVPVFPPPAVP